MCTRIISWAERPMTDSTKTSEPTSLSARPCIWARTILCLPGAGTDRTMDSEARHPDALERLRVFDLGIGSERRLHLGGGFACVLAGTRERSAAARWIATTIVSSRHTA